MAIKGPATRVGPVPPTVGIGLQANIKSVAAGVTAGAPNIDASSGQATINSVAGSVAPEAPGIAAVQSDVKQASAVIQEPAASVSSSLSDRQAVAISVQPENPDISVVAGDAAAESAAEADFNARTSQSGVVWWHGFENDDEVNNFRRTGWSTDPDDQWATENPGTGWIRRVTTDPTFPNGCMELNWPNDLASQGYGWRRPLAPFNAAGNGKGADDPGGGIPIQTDYFPVQNSSAYQTGNKYSWAAEAYESTLGAANYMGRGFYLQYKIKVPLSRVTQIPGGKFIYIDGSDSCNQELVQQVGGSPGDTGNPLQLYTNFGFDGRTNVNLQDPQVWSLNNSNHPNLTDWNTRYSTSLTAREFQPGSEATSGCEDGAVNCSTCWCIPADEWVTLLIHIIPGQGSTPGEGWGGGGPNEAQFWAALEDPTFEKTQITIWAAASNLPNGTEAYTKVWDKKDFIWSFDSSNGTNYGFSQLKFSNYSNTVKTTADTYHRMAQPMMSFDPILCPQSTPTPLEERTRTLTDGSFFWSGQGSPVVNNNDTLGQGGQITWQIEGIYYDPIRRRMHQLDLIHSPIDPEHAYYDEVDNTWTKITPNLGAFGITTAGHWRGVNFAPETGDIYYQREGTDIFCWYDASDEAWKGTSYALLHEASTNSEPATVGYHPNLFGPGRPGVLCCVYWRVHAWNIIDETWHTLNSSKLGAGDQLFFHVGGNGFYLPGRDELLITSGYPDALGNRLTAIKAGAGLEADLSPANKAEVRNAPPQYIRSSTGNAKLFACKHPKQRDVILGFDGASSTIYYTADGGETPWVNWTTQNGVTHPFYDELSTIGEMTVGSLPYHGVVAGAETTAGVTNFVYWKPPLVP